MSRESLLARILVAAGALRLGEFTLSSGRRSRVYVDARSLLGRPDAMRLVASMLHVAAEECVDLAGVDCVAGVATGGIAWAALLAHLSGKAAGYVRKARKDYGLGKRVEACPVGSRVLLVDDVATTGGSLASAAEALLNEGYRVAAALVIVDREEGAPQRLEAMGLRLCSVAKLRGILEAAARLGLLPAEEVQKVLQAGISQ